MNRVYNTSGDEPESPVANALKEALAKKGYLKDPEEKTSPEIPDLRSSLAQLQEELTKFAGLPAAVEEIKAYDRGLQELACQVAPQVHQVEVFLAAVIEAGFREEPAFKDQVSQAEEYLDQVESRPALRRYVEQTKAFLKLEGIRGFRAFREALNDLVQQNLAFKARRDPDRELQEAVPSRENGEEFIYLPQRGSIISEQNWHHVIATRDQILEAGTERREAIAEELEKFRAKVTPGLSAYKAVHEEAEGILFLSTSFTDRNTGRQRLARMLIRVGRGNFTIEEVFGPDRIEFILEQARYRRPDGTVERDRYWWFPLYPPRFDEARRPWAIVQIVYPVLRGWYENEASQREVREKSQKILAKSEISPIELAARGSGFCGIYLRQVRTATRGPGDLFLGVRGTGEGRIVLEEYLSPNEVFDLEAIVGLEINLKEPEEEEEVPEEWRQVALQTKILRGFVHLAANRQRSAEIQERVKTFNPLIPVTEGMKPGVEGYSVFHHPKAQTNSYGPVALTCQVKWQKETFVLQDYVSWVEPWVKSRGPLEFDEILGLSLPKQPAKREKPVVKAFRALLEERKSYEVWKASQGTSPEEEGENLSNN